MSSGSDNNPLHRIGAVSAFSSFEAATDGIIFYRASLPAAAADFSADT